MKTWFSRHGDEKSKIAWTKSFFLLIRTILNLFSRKICCPRIDIEFQELSNRRDSGVMWGFSVHLNMVIEGDIEIVIEEDMEIGCDIVIEDSDILIEGDMVIDDGMVIEVDIWSTSMMWCLRMT